MIRMMPEQDRFRALGIFHRMQQRRITIQQAMNEFKAILQKSYFRTGR
ncbi:hypothetical protein [Cohnella cellulosilytica]